MTGRAWCVPTADLGDLVVVMLARDLAGLRDRLKADRLLDAADLVAELVEIAEGYLEAAGG